jgi:hypothetical protein
MTFRPPQPRINRGRAYASQETALRFNACSCTDILDPRLVAKEKGCRVIARSRGVAAGIAAAFVLSQPLVVFLPQVRAQQGQAAPAAVDFKFSFGPGRLAPDAIRVLLSTLYSHELGYGSEPGASIECLDRGTVDAARSHFCTSDTERRVPARCAFAIAAGARPALFAIARHWSV